MPHFNIAQLGTPRLAIEQLGFSDTSHEDVTGFLAGNRGPVRSRSSTVNIGPTTLAVPPRLIDIWDDNLPELKRFCRPRDMMARLLEEKIRHGTRVMCSENAQVFWYKALANIRYISEADLISAIDQIATGISNFINHGEPFVVLFDSHNKSGGFMWKKLRTRLPHEDVVPLAYDDVDYTTGFSPAIERFAHDNGFKNAKDLKFVFIDDASYSGDMLNTAIDFLKHRGVTNSQIMIGLAACTDLGFYYAKSAASGGSMTVSYYIPNLEESFFTEAEITDPTSADDCGCDVLTFLSRRVPDNFLGIVACGLLNQSHVRYWNIP